MDGTSPALHAAMAKYGIKNFRFDILEHNTPIMRESFWIATFGDFGNGYNLCEGGTLNPVLRGKKHPRWGKKCPETSRRMKEFMSNGGSPWYGTGDLRKGKNNPNYGNGQKIKGVKNPMFGRKHTVETRKKMSSKALGRKNTPESNAKRSKSLLGIKNHNSRPEYTQAKWDFFLWYPLGIKETRKQLKRKYYDVNRSTIWRWTKKWKSELDNSTQPTTKED